MWLKRIWIALLPLALSSAAQGHPVAYKGAWSFMAFNQADMLVWQLLYSFERQFSLGVDFYRDTMEGPERYFLIPRLSWLVKRWNGTDSQANVYVYGGVGAARKGNATQLAAEGAIEADYETRQIYVSGKASVVGAETFKTLAVYQLRAGFAPYLGDFEGLNSWLILQAQYLPNAPQDTLRIGPLLRLFYKNVLWETGVTTRGMWNFNFMVHF
jgi:hypothetical protein